MPLDEQLVEKFKSIFLTGDGEICGDNFFIRGFHRLLNRINLGKQTSQQFLIDLPIITE